MKGKRYLILASLMAVCIYPVYLKSEFFGVVAISATILNLISYFTNIKMKQME